MSDALPPCKCGKPPNSLRRGEDIVAYCSDPKCPAHGCVTLDMWRFLMSGPRLRRVKGDVADVMETPTTLLLDPYYSKGTGEFQGWTSEVECGSEDAVIIENLPRPEEVSW